MAVAHKFTEKTRTSDVVISESVDFAGLLLSKPVLNGLNNSGFEVPSPIQLKAIPLGRCGLDLIVQAKSGTGKTCVFSVVALEGIETKANSLQVLVLAPTREIALQIWEVMRSIGSAMPGLQCHTFIGGMPVHEDKKNLQKCHIAVGTPGRIQSLIEQGMLKTKNIRLFVLDEADKLLEEGFQPQINWIYSALPDNKQMLALSATYPEYLAEHLTLYMRNPTFVRLNVTDPTLLGIKQYYVTVPCHPLPHQQFELKTEAVVRLLSSVTFSQCLIFSNLQTRAQNLRNELKAQGWPTSCIAGCLDQKERITAITQLKAFSCRVLISTDLTSRGIDADKVNLVINLDVPKDPETYLHRIGRAGRFGSYGAGVTIVSEGHELVDMQRIERGVTTHILPLPDPIPKDLVKRQLEVNLDDVVTTQQIFNQPDATYPEPHTNAEGHSPDLDTNVSVKQAELGLMSVAPCKAGKDLGAFCVVSENVDHHSDSEEGGKAFAGDSQFSGQIGARAVPDNMTCGPGFLTASSCAGENCDKVGDADDDTDSGLHSSSGECSAHFSVLASEPSETAATACGGGGGGDTDVTPVQHSLSASEKSNGCETPLYSNGSNGNVSEHGSEQSHEHSDEHKTDSDSVTENCACGENKVDDSHSLENVKQSSISDGASEESKGVKVNGAEGKDGSQDAGNNRHPSGVNGGVTDVRAAGVVKKSKARATGAVWASLLNEQDSPQTLAENFRLTSSVTGGRANVGASGGGKARATGAMWANLLTEQNSPQTHTPRPRRHSQHSEEDLSDSPAGERALSFEKELALYKAVRAKLTSKADKASDAEGQGARSEVTAVAAARPVNRAKRRITKRDYETKCDTEQPVPCGVDKEAARSVERSDGNVKTSTPPVTSASKGQHSSANRTEVSENGFKTEPSHTQKRLPLSSESEDHTYSFHHDKPRTPPIHPKPDDHQSRPKDSFVEDRTTEFVPPPKISLALGGGGKKHVSFTAALEDYKKRVGSGALPPMLTGHELVRQTFTPAQSPGEPQLQQLADFLSHLQARLGSRKAAGAGSVKVVVEEKSRTLSSSGSEDVSHDKTAKDSSSAKEQGDPDIPRQGKKGESICRVDLSSGSATFVKKGPSSDRDATSSSSKDKGGDKAGKRKTNTKRPLRYNPMAMCAPSTAHMLELSQSYEQTVSARMLASKDAGGHKSAGQRVDSQCRVSTSPRSDRVHGDVQVCGGKGTGGREVSPQPDTGKHTGDGSVDSAAMGKGAIPKQPCNGSSDMLRKGDSWFAPEKSQTGDRELFVQRKQASRKQAHTPAGNNGQTKQAYAEMTDTLSAGKSMKKRVHDINRHTSAVSSARQSLSRRAEMTDVIEAQSYNGSRQPEDSGSEDSSSSSSSSTSVVQEAETVGDEGEGEVEGWMCFQNQYAVDTGVRRSRRAQAVVPRAQGKGHREKKQLPGQEKKKSEGRQRRSSHRDTEDQATDAGGQSWFPQPTNSSSYPSAHCDIQSTYHAHPHCDPAYTTTYPSSTVYQHSTSQRDGYHSYPGYTPAQQSASYYHHHHHHSQSSQTPLPHLGHSYPYSQQSSGYPWQQQNYTSPYFPYTSSHSPGYPYPPHTSTYSPEYPYPHTAYSDFYQQWCRQSAAQQGYQSSPLHRSYHQHSQANLAAHSPWQNCFQQSARAQADRASCMQSYIRSMGRFYARVCLLDG